MIETNKSTKSRRIIVCPPFAGIVSKLGLRFGCLCHEEVSMKRKSITSDIQNSWDCVRTKTLAAWPKSNPVFPLRLRCSKPCPSLFCCLRNLAIGGRVQGAFRLPGRLGHRLQNRKRGSTLDRGCPITAFSGSCRYPSESKT